MLWSRYWPVYWDLVSKARSRLVGWTQIHKDSSVSLPRLIAHALNIQVWITNKLKMDSLKVKITRFNKRYVATETSTNLKRKSFKRYNDLVQFFILRYCCIKDLFRKKYMFWCRKIDVVYVTANKNGQFLWKAKPKLFW